jgi:hypothetical protein
MTNDNEIVIALLLFDDLSTWCWKKSPSWNLNQKETFDLARLNPDDDKIITIVRMT